ncbi:MAG: hypothetical protein HXY51_05025 [Nitrospirae bacterium]|nr:hypothetical protein [Nitrospirota bacterium]
MSYLSRRALVLLVGTTLTLSACATRPDLDVTISESDRGAVYVERIPDRAFRASHPITISADTMARVLRGVIVNDSQGVILGNMIPGKSEVGRAFEDRDVEYLAPLLVAGLTRAASDQQVGFRVVHVAAPTNSQIAGLTFCVDSVRFPGTCESEQPSGAISEESTAGSLYAYGQSLFLTLTEYRYRTKRAESSTTANRRIFNLAGMGNRTVHFVPESAKRPDSYRTALSTDATLVIDYDLLATMPAASGIQSATPVKGEPAQRDTDMDEVRKELREIKKKLAEQELERARSTPSSSKNPAPRSAP